jgi:TolA-binding protein
MRRVLALVLLAGCAWLRPALPPESDDPTRQVARADELARSGSPNAARSLYRKVIREHRDTPAAGDALYRLGRMYVDPASSLHDWNSAQIAFTRLVNEHPDSPHVDEARAWLAALDDLLHAQADAKRLRDDLERLKELDMQQERHR